MLDTMASGSRLAQCFLFYGASGLGKKSLAEWFAARLLCMETKQVPCGNCKNCRTIAQHVHPDVIWVPHSGKLGGFSVETVRSVCSSAIIAPNSGFRKIYIFSDCDAMDVRAQNILLKIIEEPPAFAYFIFTASARQSLLPTILSRLIPFGISPCTKEETTHALMEKGFSLQDAEEAVSCFHGNIGQCIAYLQDNSVRDLVSLTKEAVHCIINKDEYGLLKTFFSIGSDRGRARQLLEMLDKVIRDALVLRMKQSLLDRIGCDMDGAANLAKRLSAAEGQQFHKNISTAYAALASNVNVQLLLSALCAELMSG